MEKNVGKMDRIVRFLGGILLVLVGLWISNSVLRWVLLALGAIGIIESLIGTCWLYRWLNINTVKSGEKKAKLWKVLSWITILCALVAYGIGWLALIEKTELWVPTAFWFYDSITTGILGLFFWKVSLQVK